MTAGLKKLAQPSFVVPTLVVAVLAIYLNNKSATVKKITQS